MNKKVQKIVIKPDGIDVIMDVSGIKSIIQINLTENPEVIKKIFEKFNISDIMFYDFDEKIVRALALDETGEQLRDYLEICKQVSLGMKRISLAENMPEIEYNLRGLKTYE